MPIHGRMEFDLNQQLQGWSGLEQKLVENRINVEISNNESWYVDQTF